MPSGEKQRKKENAETHQTTPLTHVYLEPKRNIWALCKIEIKSWYIVHDFPHAGPVDRKRRSQKIPSGFLPRNFSMLWKSIGNTTTSGNDLKFPATPINYATSRQKMTEFISAKVLQCNILQEAPRGYRRPRGGTPSARRTLGPRGDARKTDASIAYPRNAEHELSASEDASVTSTVYHIRRYHSRTSKIYWMSFAYELLSS